MKEKSIIMKQTRWELYITQTILDICPEKKLQLIMDIPDDIDKGASSFKTGILSSKKIIRLYLTGNICKVISYAVLIINITFILAFYFN